MVGEIAPGGPCRAESPRAKTRAVMSLTEISRKLARAVDQLAFAPPVAFVYNPLVYAWAPHAAYLERFGQGQKRVVFLGMNPGPFGMAQTGVPFGDVTMVRDYLGLGTGAEGQVLRPHPEHPKRPVTGFACRRSEVSGTRFWGWARARFGSAARFFRHAFVVNYCPLVFMDEAGRNVTPDKLTAAERQAVTKVCDHALRQMVALWKPTWVIGVGAFAETRAREALEGLDPQVGCILHPSPASPAANRGWAGQVDAQLEALGVRL